MKKIIAVFTLCALAVSLGSCALTDNIKSMFAGDNTAEPETAGTEKLIENEITAGVYGFDTYNPLTTQSDTVIDICGFVFEPLFGIDSSMRTTNVLADSYFISADGATLTIKLKTDITWHDGTSFTASDVVYTANLIKFGGTRYDRLMEPINGIWAADSYTVCASLGRAVPDPAAVFTFPIIKNGSANGGFNAVGTGPFYMDASGGLTAYPEYHAEHASLDRINLRQLPDKEKYLSLFDASVLDFATSAELDMSSYMPKSNSHVWDFVANDMIFAGFNTGSAVFSDKYARKAVSAMLDRDDIANRVLYTRAAASDYAVNPSSWMAFDESKKHHANTETAMEFLTDGGWAPASNGMYMHEVNSRAVYFGIRVLVNSDNAERVRIAEELCNTMTALGLKAEVDACAPEVFASRITARNYDMFIGEISLLPNSDLTPLAASGHNSFGYADTETDTLIAQLGVLTAEEDLKSANRTLCEKLYEDVPFAPICFMKKSIVTSSKLKYGITPSIEGYVRASEYWGVN